MNENPQRVEEFRETISEMKISHPPPALERAYLWLGVIGVAVGFVLIVMGYNGAATTEFTPEAISYLISGGVVGLALIVVGVGLFLRYSLARFQRFWLLRNIFEQRSQTDRIVQVLERIEKLDVEIE